MLSVGREDAALDSRQPGLDRHRGRGQPGLGVRQAPLELNDDRLHGRLAMGETPSAPAA